MTEPDAPVLTDRIGSVLLITLNRPEARNAVNRAVTMAVGAAIELAASDPEIRVVVITGSGDIAFCAGGDLKELQSGDVGLDERVGDWGFAGYVSHPISIPTIAAVNGYALGGGTEIVLASDLAVVADTAVFGLPEVRHGIVAAGGGAFRMPQQVPHKVAMEALLTGRPLSAERAWQIGMVNRVVPAASVLDEAMMLAREISEQSPLAVQATKAIALGLDDGYSPGDSAAWERTRIESAKVFGGADAREGLLAFVEGRAPRWRDPRP